MDRRPDHRGHRPFLSPDETDLLEQWQLALEYGSVGADENGQPLPMPEEFGEFLLAENFGWTWQQVQDTPAIIRRRWTSMLGMKQQRARETENAPSPEAAAQAALAEIERARLETERWEAQHG